MVNVRLDSVFKGYEIRCCRPFEHIIFLHDRDFVNYDAFICLSKII